MFKKILALLKNTNKNGGQTRQRQVVESQQRRKIAPTHIGDLGEYKIEVQLRQFPSECKYLNDILIENPRSKTGYAQIDHVLITPYCLFVIETKNYKGSVRGKREDLNWTVSGKYRRYNPIKQNRTHVNALKRILKGYKEMKFVSVISFTKRCELHVDPDLREVSDEFVVYDIKLTDFIERRLKMLKSENSKPLLSEVEVNRIFELIRDENITDSKIRDEHCQRANEGKGNKSFGK